MSNARRTLLITVMFLSALGWTGEAHAQISGASATTAGSTCTGDDADGFCGFSVNVLTNNGTTLATRYAWNVNADVGAMSTRDSSGVAQHNVNFTATAPGGYLLQITTSRSGDLNRIGDTVGCEGSADISTAIGSSNVALSSGTLSLTDPGIIGNGNGTTNVPISQSSGTANIYRVSNDVPQAHALTFTWSGSVRSNSCEAAVRLGEQNGTTTGCDACGYAGTPPRTQATDGHFVTVTFTSLCGNGSVDAAVAEACDDGGANGSVFSCCTSACQTQPDGTLCDDANPMTDGDQCLAGACMGTAGTTTTTMPGGSTTTTTTTTPGGSTTSTTLAGVTDIPVAAVKLVVVDRLTAAGKAKTIFVAKDPAITKGAGTDVNDISATVTVAYHNGTESVSGEFNIPAGESDGNTGWLVNKDTVAKFVNKLAPNGSTVAKVAVIKPNTLVKLVAKERGDNPLDIFSAASSPSGSADVAYCVLNGGETNCFCSTFATCVWKSIAGDTGAKLVCKTGTGDATCAALP